MGGMHHVMLTVEDDEDAGPITEPPWAYCRLDVISGIAMLTLIPLTPAGEVPLATGTRTDLSAQDAFRLGTALVAESQESDWVPVPLHAIADRLGIQLPDAPQRSFSVSAFSLKAALHALMQDEEYGEPEEWARRTRDASPSPEGAPAPPSPDPQSSP